MRFIEIIPPVYVYLAIALMAALHFLLPGMDVLDAPWIFLGAVPLAIGIALNLAADGAFKKRGTSVKPLDESAALVTSGAFGVSRHPMYLGFTLILLGIALLAGTLTPFAVVVLFAVFIDAVFIRFEERKMERSFGEEWLAYKRRVRRWL